MKFNVLLKRHIDYHLVHKSWLVTHIEVAMPANALVHLRFNDIIIVELIIKYMLCNIL